MSFENIYMPVALYPCARLGCLNEVESQNLFWATHKDGDGNFIEEWICCECLDYVNGKYPEKEVRKTAVSLDDFRLLSRL